MKNITLLLFSGLIVLHAQPGHTITLNQAEQLRKASLVIRSLPPEPEDLEQAHQLSPSEFQSFYEKTVNDYLATEDFVATFHQHLLALFRMDLVASPYESNAGFRTYNAFDLLLQRILQKNRPWRELLLAQNYDAAKISGFGGSDLLFLQSVFYQELASAVQEVIDSQTNFITTGNGDLTPPEFIPVSAKTIEQKSVTAGAITTSRFFSRYVTTKLNKNRGRAAALFRVFLCDDMKPVVLTSDEEDKGLLDKSLMAKAHTGGVPFQTDEAKHGSEPQCMSCHYKLDPMADVFRGSGLVLNPFPSPGGLVFTTREGHKVSQDVNGFQELAAAITAEKDYKSCQVRHFWNWVIGEDVPLDVATESRLVHVFESLDEKPRDFVAELVKLKEFNQFQAIAEDQVLFSHVKPILKACDSCHAEEPLAPLLGDTYPYPKTWEVLNGMSLIDSIVEQSALHIKGQGAKMPPKQAGWVLTEKELDTLLAWIKHGAKDSQGHSHYSSGKYFQDIQQASYFSPFQSDPEPSFLTTFHRIMARKTLPNSLRKTFPTVSATSCRIQAQDKSTLGYPAPLSGLPVFSHLSPNLVFWWLNCLGSVRQPIEDFYKQNFSDWASASNSLKALQSNGFWKDLTAIQKAEIYEKIERHILGPGILNQPTREKLNKKAKTYIQSLDPNITIADTMTRISLVYMGSESFLTF